MDRFILLTKIKIRLKLDIQTFYKENPPNTSIVNTYKLSCNLNKIFQTNE